MHIVQHDRGCACKDCRPLEFALKNNPYEKTGVHSLQTNIRLSRDPDTAMHALVVIEQLRERV